ncbi:MAG: YchJ family protein [Candidatus Nanopelagicales bacterium]
MTTAEGCPCGWGAPYDDCCGRLHRGEPAATAESVMRSRYTAFVMGDAGYLARTWHSSARPDDLALDASRTWRGLHVLDAVRGSLLDADGEVEFVARWQDADGSRGRHHERSRFVREEGRWVYLDALPDHLS